MAALAFYQAKHLDAALQAADRYRARHPKGKHLARSERVAARVLKRQGKLDAAADRLAAAARAEGSGERASADLLEYADMRFGRGDYAAAQQVYQKIQSQQDTAGARAHDHVAPIHAVILGDRSNKIVGVVGRIPPSHPRRHGFVDRVVYDGAGPPGILI